MDIMKKDSFNFDLDAKRIRITNDDILSSLQDYAKNVNFRYFPSTEFDKWKGKKAHSSTIIERFGSWNNVMRLLGIEGGRERKYTPEELIDNLEKIWKELGYPPGRRQISKLGLKISEGPYRRIWGSVYSACVLLANYHSGKITKEELFKGKVLTTSRTTIPLSDRWVVLKRDHYRCVKCGKNPSIDHEIDLEIDHIIPVSKGGTNDLENLQTLCTKCNQGKKDR